MPYKSRFWADYSAREFAQLRSENLIAVLPVAAIEQHGPHLPVSVDTTIINGVIAAALPHIGVEIGALFLPTQQVGKSNEHARFPGTLSLSAGTLVANCVSADDILGGITVRGDEFVGNSCEVLLSHGDVLLK